MPTGDCQTSWACSTSSCCDSVCIMDYICKLGPHTVVRALLYVQLSSLAINTPICTPSACCAPIIHCLAMLFKWYRLDSSLLHNCHSAVADLSVQLLQYGVLCFGIMQMLQIYHAMQHVTECEPPLRRAWKAVHNRYAIVQSIGNMLVPHNLYLATLVLHLIFTMDKLIVLALQTATKLTRQVLEYLHSCYNIDN